MNEIIKNVPYNNPSLIPLGKYDIEIIQPIDINIDNTGDYGKDHEGEWSIVNTFHLDDKREVITIDLVTLKKVLDKEKMYPKMKKNEVAALSQLCLCEDILTIRGDIVKVKKSK